MKQQNESGTTSRVSFHLDCHNSGTDGGAHLNFMWVQIAHVPINSTRRKSFFYKIKINTPILLLCEIFNLREAIQSRKPFPIHKGKGKAITLQTWTGPEGSRSLRLPRFQDNQCMKPVRLSALRPGCLYPPRKYSWYSFLLETESTPGP